jgi:hypothetical protein
MDASVKMLRAIQIVMLVSIAFYVGIGERIGSVPRLSDPMMFYVLSMATVTIVGVILVVRKTLVAHSAGILRERPNDATTLGRWRAGYVMTYALSEAIALFGLVLRIIGFSLSQVSPFYIAGFILLLFYGPRRPVSSATS